MSGSVDPGIEPSGSQDVTLASGSKGPHTRLTEEQVQGLASMLDAGCFSTRQMADALGCSQSTVSRASRGSGRVAKELHRLREKALAAERQRRKRERDRKEQAELARLREATGIDAPRGARVIELVEGFGPKSTTGEDLRLAQRRARTASGSGYEAFLDRRDLDAHTRKLREDMGLDGVTGGLVVHLPDGKPPISYYPMEKGEVERARTMVADRGYNPDTYIVALPSADA